MAGDDLKTRIFGRSIRKTVLQLVVASIIVGGLLMLLGLSPLNFWRGIFDGVWDVISVIGDSFGEIVGNLAKYLVVGAAIVVPIWIVARLLTGGGSKK